MLYLIIGGSGSGKSEYAEKLAASLGRKYKNANNLIYAATMLNREDSQTRERISKHRQQRAGMGFETIELPIGLEKLCKKAGIDETSVILLECMSNLLANEMFESCGRVKICDKPEAGATKELKAEHTCSLHTTYKKHVDRYILSACKHLKALAGDVIIVTNEIFSDGGRYDELTEEYVSLLGYINSQIASMADRVIEVVCGYAIEKMPLQHIEPTTI